VRDNNSGSEEPRATSRSLKAAADQAGRNNFVYCNEIVGYIRPWVGNTGSDGKHDMAASRSVGSPSPSSAPGIQR